MKALSVKNPWAALIVSGKKDIENRTWRTNYRGTIMIHCSQKRDPLGEQKLWELATRGDYEKNSAAAYIPHWNKSGQIIGSVKIVDCVQGHYSPWAEEGLWHWVLEDAKSFMISVPAKGKLGIWNYDQTTAK